MKNSRYILMVLCGGALYGTMSSFVKLFYYQGYQAGELAFFQALLSAIILGLILCFSRSRALKGIPRQSISSILITGGILGLTNYLYYLSVSYISASLAIVILMQFTWLSLVIEWVCFRKRPSNAEITTILFVLGGTVLASNIMDLDTQSQSWLGVAIVVLSSITYSLYIVFNSRMGKNVHWQPKSTLIMVGSTASIFLVNSQQILSGTYLNWDFVLITAFLAVFGTTIPTSLFANSIPKVGAGISSILMTVELPVAILVANTVLNESLDSLQICGIALMLTSIGAMNYYKAFKRPKEQAA